MRAALAIAAIAVGANAAFIFDAERCNTNFNNPTNWVVDPWATANVTQEVQFGGSPNWRPVQVYVPASTYRMGSIEFQPNMAMSLGRDGVVLSFEEQANGPVATFSGGQEDSEACNVHCKDNYKVGNLQQVTMANYSTLNLPTANRAPCVSDDVYIPRGYAAQLQMYGFFGINSLNTVSETGAISTYNSPGPNPMYPMYSVFPPTPKLRFTPASANAWCQNNSMLGLNAQGTALSATCNCPDSCVGSDATSALDFVGDIYEQRYLISKAAKMQAEQTEQADSVPLVKTVRYSYVGLAGTGTASESAMQIAVESTGATPTFTSALSTKIVENLPSGTNVTNVVATWGQGTAGNGTGMLTCTVTLTGTAGALAAAQTDASYDVLMNRYPSDSDFLALVIFKSAAEAFTMTSPPAVQAGVLEGLAGYATRTVSIFTGGNLAQAALNELINTENQQLYATSLYGALKGYNGLVDVNYSALSSGLEVWSPSRINAYRTGLASYNSGLSASYGFATACIRVSLEYSGFNPISIGGAQEDVLVKRANRASAAYVPLAAAGAVCPLNNVTRTEKMDCVANAMRAAVTAYVSTTYSGDAGAYELANLDASARATSLAQARVRANAAVTSVFGRCGPLGAMGNGSCVDPTFAVQLTSYSNTTADTTFAAEESSVAGATTTTEAPPSSAGDTAGGGGGGGGGGLYMYVAIAAVVLILILVFIVVRKKKSETPSLETAEKRAMGGVGFVNPLYDEASPKENPGYQEKDGEDMYDDIGEHDGGYLDVDANFNEKEEGFNEDGTGANDEDGYADLPMAEDQDSDDY